MRIDTRPPTAGALVSDWLAGRMEAARFFPDHPSRLERYVREDTRNTLAGDPSGFPPPDRGAVARALAGGGPDRAARLHRFVKEEGFVVTTGQQPVVFGGPLLVVYKALSAIALARMLEGRLGRPVLPVFWIASEDHDWEEARGVSILDPSNEVHRIELSVLQAEGSSSPPTPPLHRIVPGGELPAALQHLLEQLPSSDFAPRWTELLEGAYTAEATLPDGFGRVLEGLLGDHGLFQLQAHHPEIKKATSGLLLSELEGAERSESALRRRGQEIEAAGYALQVPIASEATNLFLEGASGRERLMRDGSGFRLRRSDEHWSFADIQDKVRADSAALSPNVLLRPVVESAFLPTLAYVAGPGEMAYLAQTGPLFEAHGIHRPMVHPRLSVELVEGKVQKVLDKYALDPGELARPHHELAGALLREELPEPARRGLGAFRGAVAAHSRELTDALDEIDPTLEGPVAHLRNQTFAQLADLERKVVQALKRQNQIALEQLEKAQRHLYPGGQPQERVLSPWYHLYRYGDDLLERLADEAWRAISVPSPEER